MISKRVSSPLRRWSPYSYLFRFVEKEKRINYIKLIMNKKYIAAGAIALGAVGVLGVNGVIAAEKIGTFTGRMGEEHDLIQMTAEIVGVNGREIILKDTADGTEYTSGLPLRYSEELEVGETEDVTGALIDAEGNPFGHNFIVTEVNGEKVRKFGQFAGKVWENMTEEEREAEKQKRDEIREKIESGELTREEVRRSAGAFGRGFRKGFHEGNEFTESH